MSTRRRRTKGLASSQAARVLCPYGNLFRRTRDLLHGRALRALLAHDLLHGRALRALNHGTR
eukprot:13480815-Alexandrium_andersonii.AAC.1